MKKTGLVLFTVLGVLLVLAGIYAVGRTVAFSAEFYRDERVKLSISEAVGMSEEDLERTTQTLLDYLSGKRENMTVYAEVDGVYREVFGEQEKLHNADVARLFRGFDVFMWTTFAVSAAALVVFLAVCRKKRIRTMARILIPSVLTAAAVCLVIGVWAVIDFNSFFVSVHKLLFSNNLWQLDFETSLLIKMFPQRFFTDYLTWVTILSCVFMGAPFLAACGINAATKK